MQLKQIRSDEEFMKMELEASHFFEENQLIIETQSKRCRKTPENLSNSVIMESVGHEHPNDFTNAKYKEVLDMMIQEIERRFDNQNKSLLRSMRALIPSSKSFFSFVALGPFIAHYAPLIEEKN